MISIGLFFISPILAIIMLFALIFMKKTGGSNTYLYALLFLFIIIEVAAIVVNHQVMMG